MDCRVCQRPNASKYNHYGANFICGSCKGFFMRACQSDLYKTFIHAHQCRIDSRTRLSCKKCRFDKCLMVGMKKSYVKSLEEKCKKILVQCQSLKPVPITIQTFGEKVELERIYDLSKEKSLGILFEMYCKNPNAFVSQICGQTLNGINTDEFLTFMDFMDVAMLKHYCKLLTDHDGVSEDLEILFRTNFVRISSFYNILCFIDNWSELQDFVEYGQKNRKNSYDINQIMLVHDLFGSEDVKLNYDVFFPSPWAVNADVEVEHRRLFHVSQK